MLTVMSNSVSYSSLLNHLLFRNAPGATSSKVMGLGLSLEEYLDYFLLVHQLSLGQKGERCGE